MPGRVSPAELIYSFIPFRRHLWLHVLHFGFLDTAYELLKAMGLSNRVILFFDRALLSMVKGHQEALPSMPRFQGRETATPAGV